MHFYDSSPSDWETRGWLLLSFSPSSSSFEGEWKKEEKKERTILCREEEDRKEVRIGGGAPLLSLQWRQKGVQGDGFHQSAQKEQKDWHNVGRVAFSKKQQEHNHHQSILSYGDFHTHPQSPQGSTVQQQKGGEEMGVQLPNPNRKWRRKKGERRRKGVISRNADCYSKRERERERKSKAERGGRGGLVVIGFTTMLSACYDPGWLRNTSRGGGNFL